MRRLVDEVCPTCPRLVPSSLAVSGCIHHWSRWPMRCTSGIRSGNATSGEHARPRPGFNETCPNGRWPAGTMELNLGRIGRYEIDTCSIRNPYLMGKSCTFDTSS